LLDEKGEVTMDGRLKLLAGTSALRPGAADVPAAELAEQMRQWAAASDAVALRFGAPGDDAEPADGAV
jgi:hypothetical protein